MLNTKVVPQRLCARLAASHLSTGVAAQKGEELFVEQEILIGEPDAVQFPFPGHIAVDMNQINRTSGVRSKSSTNPSITGSLKGDISILSSGIPVKDQGGILVKRVADLIKRHSMGAGTSFVSESSAALRSGNVREPTVREDRPPPVYLSNGLESQVVAVQCPKFLNKYLSGLFLDGHVPSGQLSVIIFGQKTKLNMSSWSEKMEEEREGLTVKFLNHAREVCEELQSSRYFADAIDPSSGLLVSTGNSNVSISETDSFFRLLFLDSGLAWKVEDVGCCSTLKHIEWGFHCFAGFVVTNAPCCVGSFRDLVQQNL